MITAAQLQVKLSTTGADAVKRDLQGLGTAVDQTAQKSGMFGKVLTGAFIAGGTALAGVGIGKVLTSWITGSSNLAEAQSKVNVVYGKSATSINKWAKTTAKAFGITETAALDTAGTFGNLFTNMGFTQDAAAGMSMTVTGLSADMSSFFNVSQPQVIDALTSAFVGEYDALQRLGVPINAAAVEQYALNNGIWDGVDAMTEAERAQAVYGLVMENTTNAQGDFARTSGEMANQMRILSAQTQELGVRIGSVFLPAANALVGWAIDAVDYLGRLGDVFGAEGFGGVVRQIASDLSGLVVDLAGWTINVGIPTVTGWIVDAAGNVWDALKAAAGWTWDNRAAIGTVMLDIGGWAISSAMSIWEAVENFIMGGADNGMSGDGTGGARPAFDQSIGEVAVKIGGWLISSATALGDALVEWVQAGLVTAQDLGNVAVSVGAIIWEQGADIFGGFVTWVAGMIGLQDSAPIGEAIGAKVGEALRGAFDLGGKLGGVLGGGIEGLASIAQWIADQINATDFSGAGEAIGEKLGRATIAVFAGGLGFEALKTAFFAGVVGALGDLDWASIGSSFWNLFSAVSTAPTEFVGGLVTGIGAAFTDAVGQISWASVASQISAKLAEAIGTVKDFAGRIIPKLYDEFSQAISGVDWAGLATLIGEKIRTAISDLVGFAVDLGATLGSEILQAIGEADFSGIAGALKDKFLDAAVGIGKAVWDAVISEILGASGDRTDDTPRVEPGEIIPSDTNYEPTIAGLAGIANGYFGVRDSAMSAADAIKTFWAAVSMHAAAGGGGAGGAPAAGPLQEVVTGLQAIITQAQLTSIALGTAGIDAGRVFVTGVAAGIAGGGGAIAAATGTALAGAQAAGLKGVSIGTGIGSALGTALAAGIAGKAGAAAAAVGTVLGAANGAGLKARGIGNSIGRALGEGIVAGLNSMQGAVAAAAAALISIANGAAAATGGIKSPSTVWTYYGRMFGEGLGVGFGQSESGVARSSAALIGAANASLMGLTSPTVPYVAGGGLGQGASGGGVNVTVHVHVAGDVMYKDNLTRDIAEAIWETEVEEAIRHRMAAGVS